jgi:hypothetical protein
MTGEETLPEFTSNRPPQVRIGASSTCLAFSSALTARSALYLCRNAQGNWRPPESSPAGGPLTRCNYSGDGTVNAILEAGLPLGILRLATTNDLVRTLGIPGPGRQASSQAGETLQRLYSQHEPREKIFALNLYLRKKAKKSGFVRAKIEGEFRPAPRFGVGD